MNINSSTLQVDEETVLKGINFTSTGSGTLSATSWQLRHLSVVDTSGIPLSFIVGPAQEVWTDDENTITWFEEHLAADTASKTARLGVLAAVCNVLDETTKSMHPTEVLFFASDSSEASRTETDVATMTIKAIPLNSAISLYLPSPPLSPQQDPAICDAKFLPPLEELQATAVSNLKKRKQVSTVFDEATERRRKARRHGGESAAAVASGHSQDNGTVNVLIGRKNAKLVPKGAEKPETSRPHSRTGSVSTTPHEPPRRVLSRSPSMSSEIRPASRKGIIESSKRSSLSRVSSLADTASTEERNKDAISRLVMAGMRLYGLQQRKKMGHVRKLSQSQPTLPEETTQDDAAKDEEYKLIYHQTYKGTVFAFRRALSTEHLHSNPAALQDTVDKLLAIYCSDPLAPS